MDFVLHMDVSKLFYYELIYNIKLTPEVVANYLAPLITNENCDFIFNPSTFKSPFKN